MGRYKGFREPRRRGFDDDYAPQDWITERMRGSPKLSASARGSEPVEAIVKWFNAEKGFGFVAVTGGADAFLHVRTLESAGHKSVPEGARLKVWVGQGEKGPQVSEVVEVDTGSAEALSTAKCVVPSLCSQQDFNDQHRKARTQIAKGTVKWFNPTKGYGFIQPQGGGKD